MSRFLTEEWDVTVLMACGTLYRLSEAPCPVPCIEYPAQIDNSLVKSSRQMDLAKVCMYPHARQGLPCILLSKSFICATYIL